MGHEERPTITMSSWGDYKENTILSAVIDDFHGLHTGVRVKLLRIPFLRYSARLFDMVARENAPDVVFVNTGNVPEIFERGILEPLNGYIDSDSSFPISDFDQSLIERFTADSKLYVLPRDISPDCLVYYNKNAFDEVRLPYPSDQWTWDDLLTAAKALTRRENGRITRWGFVDDVVRLEPWIYSSGGRWVDDVRNPSHYVFDNPAVGRGLKFRADMILEHKVMPPPDWLASSAVHTLDMFKKGLVGMFFSGLWYAPHFRAIRDFEWDVAMFPSGPGGRSFGGVGSGYGILKSSGQKKSAWDLVKFLSGPEGEKKMTLAGLIQPALKSLGNSKVFLDGRPPHNKKLLLEAVQYGVYDPMISNWSETHDAVILPGLEGIWTGTSSAEKAVSLLFKEISRVLPIAGSGK